MAGRFGATHIGVWIIKHIVSPFHSMIFRLAVTIRWKGKVGERGILLLTTRGRRTGKDRSTPLFYLRTGETIIICNVNPGFERTNPWVLNIRAHPNVKIQIGRETGEYRARSASETEIENLWPRLLEVWPAYKEHYQRSGQRSIFILSWAEKGSDSAAIPAAPSSEDPGCGIRTEGH